MLRYTAQRLALSLPVFLSVVTVVFFVVRVLPGDPAQAALGDYASKEAVQALRERMGLNDPLPVQYGHWVAGAVRGDFGDSLITGHDVRESMLERLPASLSLVGGALLVTIALGIAAGIFAAAFEDRWPDKAVRAGSAVSIAFPNYFVGMLLVLVFAVWNEWLPASQYVRPSDDLVLWAKHLVLPSIALGVPAAAVVARQLRTAMVGVLGRDYVRTARAKGLSQTSVLFKHALKNAAIPVVVVLIGQAGLLVGGTVIIEQVFGIQGIGSLAISSITQRDIPVIQAVVVFTTTIVLLGNLSADIVYGWLNPRIRIR
jgi:peptide/nickel transport system permease protein